MNAPVDSFPRLRDWLAGKPRQATADADEPPLRAELFSADQMATHGKRLAASHTTLARGRVRDRLLARLADNERVLVDVCRQLTEAVADKRRVTPAGEWLLDNFYLLEEQVRMARSLLPEGYSRALPRLADSPTEPGAPRVYDIALETVSHGDGRVDAESLGRFVTAYQTVTPLELGELWAIPIMLRLAVIENLRRVSVRVAAGWVERELAGTWADRLIQTVEDDPRSLILVIADMVRSNPPMVGAFVAELARRLQGRGPALALPLTWIEQRLAQSGQTIVQLVQSENQQQAADQVSISNSIGSLRVLGTLDWRDFVENLSLVEQTLRGDPGGVYGRMDFATRDHYRHAPRRSPGAASWARTRWPASRWIWPGPPPGAPAGEPPTWAITWSMPAARPSKRPPGCVRASSGASAAPPPTHPCGSTWAASPSSPCWWRAACRASRWPTACPCGRWPRPGCSR